MEAGNKGAHLGGGTSVGLNIVLPLSSISIHTLTEIKPEF
jgi:predicted Rossmann-fold nucleotide-binding protein